jgi:hypothetical protein
MDRDSFYFLLKKLTLCLDAAKMQLNISFFWYWVFELKALCCQAGALLLEPHSQPFLL